MSPPHRHDHRFHLRGDLMRATVRLRTAVGKSTQTTIGITDQPTVNSATINPIADGDIGDPRSLQHLPHRQIPLLNHGQLRKHSQILLGSGKPE
jgi:hypothetical protein